MKFPYCILHRTKYNNNYYLINNVDDLYDAYFTIFKHSKEMEFYRQLLLINPEDSIEEYFEKDFIKKYGYSYTEYLNIPENVRKTLNVSIDHKITTIKNRKDDIIELALLKTIENENESLETRKKALKQFIIDRRYLEYEQWEILNFDKIDKFE